MAYPLNPCAYHQNPHGIPSQSHTLPVLTPCSSRSIPLSHLLRLHFMSHPFTFFLSPYHSLYAKHIFISHLTYPRGLLFIRMHHPITFPYVPPTHTILNIFPCTPTLFPSPPSILMSHLPYLLSPPSIPIYFQTPCPTYLITFSHPPSPYPTFLIPLVHTFYPHIPPTLSP